MGVIFDMFGHILSNLSKVYDKCFIANILGANQYLYDGISHALPLKSMFSLVSAFTDGLFVDMAKC